MENRNNGHESEYSVMSPVERHGELVRLFGLFPKESAYEEHDILMTRQLESLERFVDEFEINMDTLRDGEKTPGTRLVPRRVDGVSRDELDRAQEIGDIRVVKRANSADKRGLLRHIKELLQFAPITVPFKEMIMMRLSIEYDHGLDSVEDVSHLTLHAVVSEEQAKTGGFFNEENAFEVESKAFLLTRRNLNYRIDLMPAFISMGLGEEPDSKVDEKEIESLCEWQKAIEAKYQVKGL
jgi:hypothetical protein